MTKKAQKAPPKHIPHSCTLLPNIFNFGDSFPNFSHNFCIFFPCFFLLSLFLSFHPDQQTEPTASKSSGKSSSPSVPVDMIVHQNNGGQTSHQIVPTTGNNSQTPKPSIMVNNSETQKTDSDKVTSEEKSSSNLSSSNNSRPKRISFDDQRDKSGSSHGSPCSLCDKCDSHSNYEDEFDSEDKSGEVFVSKEEETSESSPPLTNGNNKKVKNEGSDIFCNGLYREKLVPNTPQPVKKHISTDTKADVASGFHPTAWLYKNKFASLPRSASSSVTKLLGSHHGDSGANSSLSLNESPRHLVTYVTSSMETIPVEINQDIPDVML